MKTSLLLSLALLAGSPAGRAGDLQFKSNVVSLEAKPGQAKLTTMFEYTNTGPTTIDVTAIETSCHCTVAKLDTPSLGPGASGRVMVEFIVGTMEGDVSRLITLTTSERPAGAYQLRLDVHIPRLVMIEPKYATWSASEPKSARMIVVSGPPSGHVEFLGSPDQNSLFAVDAVHEGDRWVLSVTPKAAAPGTSVDLPLDFNINGTEVRRSVLLRVLPEPAAIDPLAQAR